MSGTGGAAPPIAVLGLDIGGPWHRGAAQKKSRALVQTYLLTGTVQPPPSAAGGRARTPLRLPSLVAAAKVPRRRSSMARLSLSEPSLLAPSENILSEGLSASRHTNVLQKRPPPPSSFTRSSTLLPGHGCHLSEIHEHQKSQQPQSCVRPAYVHFSQAIQPSRRPRPVRRHSHNPEMVRGELRPSAARRRSSLSQGEPLSVVGKPCLLSCSQRPPAGPARPQLHVFLPSEAEGEEADSESVDEGFMDELDGKITSLKLKQGAPQIAADQS